MMLNICVTALGSAVLWCFLQNDVTPQNMVTGFIVGAIIGFVLKETFPPSKRARKIFNIKHWLHITIYLFHLTKEILIANYRVTRLVLAPRLNIRPGIVALPTAVRGDVPVTILGNSITLTPGTITMLVSDDRKTLYVHTLDIEQPQQTKDEIKETLEKYVLRLDE